MKARDLIEGDIVQFPGPSGEPAEPSGGAEVIPMPDLAYPVRFWTGDESARYADERGYIFYWGMGKQWTEPHPQLQDVNSRDRILGMVLPNGTELSWSEVRQALKTRKKINGKAVRVYWSIPPKEWHDPSAGTFTNPNYIPRSHDIETTLAELGGAEVRSRTQHWPRITPEQGWQKSLDGCTVYAQRLRQPGDQSQNWYSWESLAPISARQIMEEVSN